MTQNSPKTIKNSFFMKLQFLQGLLFCRILIFETVFLNGSDFVSDLKILIFFNCVILACPHNVPLDIIFLLDTRNKILKHERKRTFTNIREQSRIILLEVNGIVCLGKTALSRQNVVSVNCIIVPVEKSCKVINFQLLVLRK